MNSFVNDLEKDRKEKYFAKSSSAHFVTLQVIENRVVEKIVYTRYMIHDSL